MTATALNDAERAIGNVGRAAELLGDAHAREQELQDLKGLRKKEAILRLIGTPNPLTQKGHSASSAEAVCEQDEEYFAFLRECRAAIAARYRAAGEFEAAKLRGKLEVVLVDVRAHGVEI